MYKMDEMHKMNKTDCYCIKCLKVTDNGTNIELKY